ncbi:MAG: lipid-A-disaccharide synthase [Rikenellaceae bacterium]
MKYFLIAGEPSGDLHGSNLMKGLLKSDPEAEFFFWGGDKMAEVGGVENLGLHYTKSSFFGFVQVLFNIVTIIRQLFLCKRHIREFAPDVVILIDYAGFNLKIAKYAKSLKIKTFYYIAPKVWAWKESRIKKIRKYVDELFVIFPFEVEYFAKARIRGHYEGNPLKDSIGAKIDNMPSRASFLCENNLLERPLIALVSGSRASEIKANLPLMRHIAEKEEFNNYQFVVAGVDWLSQDIYDKWLEGSNIAYVEGQTYELLYHSEAALVTSGTATLETALIGTPQVVLFRLPWWQVMLKPIFLSIKYFSLVNINLGREAVREILQSSLNRSEGVKALKRVLVNGPDRAAVLESYAELDAMIGNVGASDRFAQKMVDLLNAADDRERRRFRR